MPRPIHALIHEDALAHNLQRARRAAPDAKVWAVVKADAYGHGIDLAYAGLRGADGFALLDLAEAERVRSLGWRGPILLLEGAFSARDLEACSRLDLWHVVHREDQVDWLAAHKTQRAHRVFLKLNSGMNRLGFTPATFRGAWLRLDNLVQVEHITLMTHFSDADSSDADSSSSSPIAAQRAVFEAACDGLDGELSICNSAATLRFAPSSPVDIAADWVRPGIMLYGSAPDFPARTAEAWDLQPAMSLRTELIAIQSIQPGDAVGYGSLFRADRPMRIGIAACGYADGYPRVAPTGTPVLVDGMRTRLAGRVSMDMITIDLTPIPDARIGSEVTLWGRAGNGGLLQVDEVAHAAGTLGYELLCAVAPRVAKRGAR